jgi:hypothetical protein
MVYLFQGKPRHEGLGIPEDVYLEKMHQEGGEDEINGAIQSRDKDLTPSQARAQLQDIHGELMRIVEPMSDEDLMKPYRHFLPNEPGRGDDDSPILYRVHGNTAGHFEEHLGWIEALAGKREA